MTALFLFVRYYKEVLCTMAKEYEVTVTKTGSVIITADSKDDAYNKVLEMPDEKISREGNFTSWEPSDVEEVNC